MKTWQIGFLAAVVLFAAGCAVVPLTVEPDFELPVIPVSDNPYLQMLRALDTMELDAHVVLNGGRFTVPELPVAGAVHVQVPDDLDLHVLLSIEFNTDFRTAMGISLLQ